MDTIKNFLLKIDGFIYKYYKLPTFLYFIFTLIFFLDLRSHYTLIRISYDTRFVSIGLTNDIMFVIGVASPLLIIYIWKRIFHPKD